MSTVTGMNSNSAALDYWGTAASDGSSVAASLGSPQVASIAEGPHADPDKDCKCVEDHRPRDAMGACLVAGGLGVVFGSEMGMPGAIAGAIGGCAIAAGVTLLGAGELVRNWVKK